MIEPTNSPELREALEPYKVEMMNIMARTAAEARYDVPESVLFEAIQSLIAREVAKALDELIDTSVRVQILDAKDTTFTHAVTLGAIEDFRRARLKEEGAKQ